ncbi:hypothetical protein K4K49_008365 [Colletotrichum sp. SAR 10_70]|nr:hypothetical protein K4K50_010077 [Colletotrichum sp. SAR 10_71]KAI8187370.1 hypothetical protein K4K51_008879 [Colletotrichum sp. SAR 10_75]KAI8199746.1 hypothetical protein KHU50_007467 [Colletotrichum sp. SAR 10_65]KAI8203305.1 hypothetical protein K4K49_008365 [Colletotrichum sp. SAR 10_70]KAI8212382.1 hypothetical protein K4K52_008314 [Colletotrichum sp. SAR 10_76]KAI8222767.1 hypothetical protein K4K53_007096 [Colletotrichum sp. SAR 10_77]KAI8234281.1 hypothetical protein K4K54_00869
MDRPASVPFTVRVLDDGFNHATTPARASPPGAFGDLLPATSRAQHDHITVPRADDPEFLGRELFVRRLNDVQDLLWICGRPMPPRPLHYQLLTSREIHVTENPELHLVWAKNRIFVKPIPRWLLDPDFWAAHLLVTTTTTDDGTSSSDGKRHQSDPRRELVACALGFLFSYTALVAYESDFRIAVEKGLMPPQVSWDRWRALSAQIVQNHCYASVNPRYWYGELRLSRLNKIYRVRLGYLLRGYSKVASHALYEDLLRDNFAALAAVLGYVVIVLTAMQVGLATDQLVGDKLFQSVSYGFTVFSILAPLIACFGIVAIVVVMFLERHCLVTVGATARFTQLLTEVVSPTFLNFLVGDRYTHLTLQCGKDYEHFSRNILPTLVPRWPTLEITAFDFVDDLTVEMTKCQAAAGRERGVVICHAGTGTILDGMRVNVPLVVVPNPTLKDNHQVELAEEIQRQGYGIWGHLGDISYALEQLVLQLDKTKVQFKPHSVKEDAEPLNVDLWQVTSAMLGRYAVETPQPTNKTGAGNGGSGEVQREEVAQMTMG